MISHRNDQFLLGAKSAKWGSASYHTILNKKRLGVSLHAKIEQDNKQVKVKHGSNFIRVHICSLVKINKVISEDKSKKVISKELKNEKDTKYTNVPDATERIVSAAKDIAEA